MLEKKITKFKILYIKNFQKKSKNYQFIFCLFTNFIEEKSWQIHMWLFEEGTLVFNWILIGHNWQEIFPYVSESSPATTRYRFFEHL